MVLVSIEQIFFWQNLILIWEWSLLFQIRFPHLQRFFLGHHLASIFILVCVDFRHEIPFHTHDFRVPFGPFIISTSSCDEDVTCHYPWWLGLIATDDMDFLQWWHGYRSCLCSSCRFWSLVPWPSKGSLILESLGLFDHQSFHVFFVLRCFLCLPSLPDFLCACLPCYSWNHYFNFDRK